MFKKNPVKKLYFSLPGSFKALYKYAF